MEVVDERFKNPKGNGQHKKNLKRNFGSFTFKEREVEAEPENKEKEKVTVQKDTLFGTIRKNWFYSAIIFSQDMEKLG